MTLLRAAFRLCVHVLRVAAHQVPGMRPIAAVLALAAASLAIEPGSDMPRVNIDAHHISASGICALFLARRAEERNCNPQPSRSLTLAWSAASGAFMAMQMHVSYSRTINAAGLLGALRGVCCCRHERSQC